MVQIYSRWPCLSRKKLDISVRSSRRPSLAELCRRSGARLSRLPRTEWIIRWFCVEDFAVALKATSYNIFVSSPIFGRLDNQLNFKYIPGTYSFTPAMNSKDGFEWTEKEGLRQGVPSIGLILPSTNLSSSNDVFDVIVIGAGYTALTAARDATISGNAANSSLLSG